MTDILMANRDVTISDINDSVERACLSGDWNGLDTFLRNSPQQKIKSSLLFTIIQNLKVNGDFNSYLNFQACFKLLLINDRINDVNCNDGLGNTLLHYTVEYKWDELTILLLKHGAYIGRKNSQGKLPIDGINPTLLREFFNSQMTTTYNDHTMIGNNFEIKLDYSFLIKKKPNDKEMSQSTNQFYPIEFISQSEHLRDLILHPLIQYLIWIKSEALTFLLVWNAFTFIVSILTVICITFFNTENKITLDQPTAYIITFITTCFCIAMYILMVIFKILDFLNGSKTVRDYGLWQFILGLGYLVIAFILIIILLIDNGDLRKTLTAICILLIAIDINVNITTVPHFQEMSIHFLMLKKITFKFVKVLLFYIIILFAFSLSFCVLDAKITADSNVLKLLGTFWMRVIAMMIGELNLEFENHLVFYYIIMLLFIFIIPIVLINLLNGLAIYDVNEIRGRAKLINLAYRVQLIGSCNNFVTNNVRLRRIIFIFRRIKYKLVEIVLCRYVKEIKIQPNMNLSKITSIEWPLDPLEEEFDRPKINNNILNELMEYFQQELEVKVMVHKEDELKHKLNEINKKLDILMSRI